MTFDEPDFITSQLITYIGNKRKMLPKIHEKLEYVKERLGKKKISCLDLFSGSGCVARLMKQHADTLFVNDLETYSFITNLCYLRNFDKEMETELANAIANIPKHLVSGFITEMYAPADDNRIKAGERVFYTHRNAQYIDTVRQYVCTLPTPIKEYVTAALIYEASVHTNTSGIFKGFHKKNGIGHFGGAAEAALSRIKADIEVKMPVISKHTCDVGISSKDAGEYVKENADNPVDFCYLDPPYNQHPYGSNYFMLNLIADYTKPKEISTVSGIPEKWNRSVYNKRKEGVEALLKVVEEVNAKYVLVSYSSEAFLPVRAMVAQLAPYGLVNMEKIDYNVYRGCRNLHSRERKLDEYLLLIEK